MPLPLLVGLEKGVAVVVEAGSSEICRLDAGKLKDASAFPARKTTLDDRECSRREVYRIVKQRIRNTRDNVA
jgi:hypothetical protein